ncbi:MAG: glycerate kinase [Alphaproteobacteria bacterium]|nr:glycerate kinase [Alphaproteobacteria bacterium]
MDTNPRSLLTGLFRSAVDAASPANCVPGNLPRLPRGRTVLVGAGKAAASMAREVEEHWSGPLTGLVVTRYGHGVPCRNIEVIEAGHPVPDAEGLRAAERMLASVRGLNADDLVLALISGGGSSLFAAPAEGLALSDKQSVTRALLKCGAPISEINCVRKHLSAVKGGRLALAAAPAQIVSLIISDVPGDDPAVIASGPTAPDSTTRGDASAILRKYGIAVPDAVQSWLANPLSETPKPGHASLARVHNRIISSAKEALEAAARAAQAAGYKTIILGDALEGEAREVAREHARLALAGCGPCVFLSGGETTVTVQGAGRGGRNAEFALALALALNGARGIHAIACDTDGIDGTEDNAGAMIGPDTLARARGLGLNPAGHLADNDAYGLFAALGDLVVTGPTLTNVNDFRAVLIGPEVAG